MIATILPIERYLNCEKVAFFTIRLDVKEKDEFSDFNYRMKGKLANVSELGELILLIDNMGNKWGAKRKYFTDERNAHRFVLPVEVHTRENSEYGLRLYCIRYSETVVIILNGDIKTRQNPNDCANCKAHFQLATKVAKAIDEAISDGQIAIEDFDIKIEEDFEIII